MDTNIVDLDMAKILATDLSFKNKISNSSMGGANQDHQSF